MSPTAQSSRALRWGLIADDLAGACDAGVQFASRGFVSVVEVGNGKAADDSTNLRILNTNSRNDSPKVARAKVARALHCLESDGRALIYKKIDSTLRGNLGAEILAAMRKRPLAVVAPAFPAMGRQIRNGCLYVAGAIQPHPVDLVALLRQQCEAEVTLITRRFLTEGVEVLGQRLEECSKRGNRIVVIDTAVQHDLAVIARAAWKLRENPGQEIGPLLVGSAGLASELARLLQTKYRRRGLRRPPASKPRRSGGPVAVIVGSTHAVSSQQCKYLLAHRLATSVSFEGDVVREARQAVDAGGHLLINTSLSAPREAPPAALTQTLADPRVRGLVMTGGDTADLVVRALGASGIILMREILPGIPWGRLIGGAADGKPVATKAGGFGRPDALARMADFLARLPR